MPLTPRLVDLFRRLPRRKCPWIFCRQSRVSARTGFTQINDRCVLSHLKAVLKKLGLPSHVYTFRHSVFSYALVRGVPEGVVRQWVGNVDDQTLRWYTRIADKESHVQMETVCR